MDDHLNSKAAGAVPIHDWQKGELARRKANLQKTPASALDWDQVKRNIRARGSRREAVTERLNELYSSHPAKIDDALHCAQLKSLKNET